MEPEFQLKLFLFPSVCGLNSVIMTLVCPHVFHLILYVHRPCSTSYLHFPLLHCNYILSGKVSIIIILVLYNITASEDVIYLIILLQLAIWIISIVLILETMLQ